MDINKIKKKTYRLNLKQWLQSSNTFIILYILCFYGFTYFYLSGIAKFSYDTAVQIKAGQWIIENKQLISGDIFSWHEELNWIPHEQLWYIFIGAIYSLGGIAGICIIGAIFNIATIYLCVKEAKFSKDVTNISIIISLLMLKRIGCTYFPSTEIRPQLFSTLMITILIIQLIHKDNKIYKYFPIITWVVAMLHGGLIKVFFIVIALHLVVDTVYEKNIKRLSKNTMFIALGFITSLLTPNLLDTWTYAGKQEMYPEIRSTINEWTTGQMELLPLIIIVAVTIGIVMDDRWRQRDKAYIFKSLCFFMFAISTVIYIRMITYFAIMTLVIMPNAIENLIKYALKFFNEYINNGIDKVAKFVTQSSKYVFIVANTILLILLPIRHINVTTHVKNNDINSSCESAGYDIKVIDILKEKGYTKIYNDYNIGTWLLFNDIKVHIDNRLDPYLKSYSGEDHIHNAMFIDNLTHLDDFYEKYHPDAIILEYYTNGIEEDNKTQSGEVYEHSNYGNNFTLEIETFRSERYKKIYDNTTMESSSPMRWIIYECQYNEDGSIIE